VHQVGDLFELNVKLRCQNVKVTLLFSTLTCHENERKHKDCQTTGCTFQQLLLQR